MPLLSSYAPQEKIRDTLYREDHSTVRTRSGPRAMATLRNLAVGALHLAGRHDTTEATRWASRNMTRPFTILGLTLLHAIRYEHGASLAMGTFARLGPDRNSPAVLALTPSCSRPRWRRGID